MHHLSVADATNHQWNADFNAIACETYLGRPFSAEPKPEVLDEVMNDVDTIHRKFLQNVARQTDVGFRMCIAVPAWNTTTGFKHLKVLDSLEELGYNRVKFAHVRTRDLIYYRDKQVVGRELVTLIRK
jgi:tRNA G10  N-methylase Trm11